MNDRHSLDGPPLNPTLRKVTDGTTDTSRTAAPLESISIRKPHGGYWAWICLAVLVACILVSLVLVFG
ncbi:hypothetical protein [Antarcticirhabdus aurantiaca]|uniref:Uncharacterized protein n=1 Tax=Antarcticirhabdus aurantiaca TaxID=2606717 RepID=A0ACD4NMT0_9HYPH|nr:hypothetical protein [Antarcticirhabdus aurantiaca]WAJ28164.1 hypothetical protein OXU80_25630 [Jeongeuplla avenae]